MGCLEISVVVGLIRTGDRAEDERVVGVFRVDVQITEVGVSQRVRVREVRRGRSDLPGGLGFARRRRRRPTTGRDNQLRDK